MSSVVEISFYCPKNVRFLSSKLGEWQMQTKQLIDCGLSQQLSIYQKQKPGVPNCS